jgi:phthalate 4,5-cis-dihydrodiol dehydrogenase
MTYGGYAHFDTAEFNDWIGETGSPVDRGGFERARKNIRSLGTPEAEARHKQQTGFAGRGLSLPKGAFQHQSFGVFIASCERADLRHLPQGVGVYADNGNRVVPVSGGRGAGNRSAVIDELVDAVRGVRPAVHDGAWAKATLEVCLAVLDSGRRRLEVSLRHQVGLDRGPARP